MGAFFKAKENPKFEEGTPKMYGSTPYRKIKACVMKKELGEESDECRKIFKELNIDVVE